MRRRMDLIACFVGRLVMSLCHCVQEPSEFKEYLLKGEALEMDWVKALDVADAMSCFEELRKERPLKVLVLYGSLRTTSYSKLLAMEFAR